MSPTTATAPRHPAAFPNYLLAAIELHLTAERRALGRPLKILDPFAGLGRIHELPKRLGATVGVEIEPEWAELRRGTIIGDATALPAEWARSFDAVATSPCYGNRMSDHHEAKDSCAVCQGTGAGWTREGCADAPFLCPDCHDTACACGGYATVMRAHNKACPDCRERLCSGCGGTGLSRRYTYRHALGRPLSERNAGQMQWGDGYRQLHAEAWAEARRVLRPDGLMLVNVKNHIRAGVEQFVVEWHAQELARQGFEVEQIRGIEATGMLHGANRGTRVKFEQLIAARAR